MVRFDLDVGIELERRVFGNLSYVSACRCFHLKLPYQCLGLLYVLIAKQELSVEVAEIDRVQVGNVDFAEAGQDEVLEQFASDAASAHHENA